MAITTLDSLPGLVTQFNVPLIYTATGTTVAATTFSMFGLAGQPGGGTLAGANTANGVVPTDATAGHPRITAFAGSEGIIARATVFNTLISNIYVYDMLFKAGAYTAPNNTTLTSIPSFSGRIPNSDFTSTQIWIEQVTTFTGTPSFNVTYTNQDGTTSRSTGTVSTGVATGTVRRMYQLPLQSGDTGVQQITNVTSTVATAGTFNALVLRPLFQARVPVAASVNVMDIFATGGVRVFDTSALYIIVQVDTGTSSGLPQLTMDIKNG